MALALRIQTQLFIKLYISTCKRRSCCVCTTPNRSRRSSDTWFPQLRNTKKINSHEIKIRQELLLCILRMGMGVWLWSHRRTSLRILPTGTPEMGGRRITENQSFLPLGTGLHQTVQLNRTYQVILTRTLKISTLGMCTQLSQVSTHTQKKLNLRPHQRHPQKIIWKILQNDPQPSCRPPQHHTMIPSYMSPMHFTPGHPLSLSPSFFTQFLLSLHQSNGLLLSTRYLKYDRHHPRVQTSTLSFEAELLQKIKFKASSKVSTDAFLFKAFKFFDLLNSGALPKSDFFRAIAKCGVLVDSYVLLTSPRT
jgi:hypothetical protein